MSTYFFISWCLLHFKCNHVVENQTLWHFIISVSLPQFSAKSLHLHLPLLQLPEPRPGWPGWTLHNPTCSRCTPSGKKNKTYSVIILSFHTLTGFSWVNNVFQRSFYYHHVFFRCAPSVPRCLGGILTTGVLTFSSTWRSDTLSPMIHLL